MKEKLKKSICRDFWLGRGRFSQRGMKATEKAAKVKVAKPKPKKNGANGANEIPGGSLFLSLATWSWVWDRESGYHDSWCER